MFEVQYRFSKIYVPQYFELCDPAHKFLMEWKLFPQVILSEIVKMAAKLITNNINVVSNSYMKLHAVCRK